MIERLRASGNSASAAPANLQGATRTCRRGSRLTTYAIEAPAGSGTIAVNGAAAHLNHPGDLVILACFAYLSEGDAAFHRPCVVFVDQNNNIVERRAERVDASA